MYILYLQIYTNTIPENSSRLFTTFQNYPCILISNKILRVEIKAKRLSFKTVIPNMPLWTCDSDDHSK